MSARKPAPDFGSEIDRMRRLAAEAADHLLLADGPVHPDAGLLDACAEALSLLRRGEDIYRARPVFKCRGRAWTDEDRRLDGEMMVEYYRCIGQASSKLRAVTKLNAASPAGIYAKAACVRASRTGARLLAMSLARDLLENPVLRRSLWPAGGSR